MPLLERFKDLTTGTKLRTILSSLLVALLIPITLFANTQSWELRKQAVEIEEEGNPINFPEDEGNHPEFGVEWWYLNLHLTGRDSGKSYAGAVAFFRSSYLPDFRLIEITDETNGQFFYNTVLGTLQAEQGRLDVRFPRGDGTLDSWHQDPTDALRYQLDVLDLDEDLGLNLSLSSTKPPLLEDGDGYVQISPDTYSYYYSQTGIVVGGNLTVKGFAEPVSGIGWVDHQWFNPGFARPTHEWFSVQLDNGADLVFWHLFYQGERILPKITILYPDGHQESPQDFRLTPLDYWQSPSGKLFVSKWRLAEVSSNTVLTIETAVDNQLVQARVRGSTAEVYEGSTIITGKMMGVAVTGKGFAELSHSYVEIPECFLEGDTDCDCDVDIFDLVRVATNYGRTLDNPEVDSRADIVPDGRINIFDLVKVGVNYGRSCD